MSELQKHIGPLRDKETDIKKIWKRFKGTFEIIWHGLIPHKAPVEAEKEILPAYFTQTDLDETYYEASKDMYKESQERIKHLEEKAFKLLTYISVLSALLFFFLGKELSGITNLLVLISIGILVIAMIISLRCVGIKTQKAFFINAIFNFDNTPIDSKKSNEISAELMNCAVYNQSVSDNTADILKASRYMLSIAIITTVLALILFFTVNDNSPKTKIQNVSVEFRDTTIVDTFKESIDNQSNMLDQINENMKNLNISVKENVNYLDSINESIKCQHTTKAQKQAGGK